MDEQRILVLVEGVELYHKSWYQDIQKSMTLHLTSLAKVLSFQMLRKKFRVVRSVPLLVAV